MKKLNALFSLLAMLMILTVTMCLSSCGTEAANEHVTESSPVVVNLPQDDTVNGYRLPVNEEEKKEEERQNDVKTPQDSSDSSYTPHHGESDVILYYANTNSKKFHKSSCIYADRINIENLLITEDREELINSGYEPCKKCCP